jgi:serine/threonine-protein kinase RsbW
MSALQRDVLRLELPCAAKYLQVVRLAVGGAADRAGLSVEDIHDLKVAVTEACTNVIDHAFDEDAIRSGRARMVVTMIIGEGEIRVEVEDEGRGFEPKHVLAHFNSAPPQPGRLGLYLIRQMTDELQIISAPGSGTKISFVKRGSR